MSQTENNPAVIPKSVSGTQWKSAGHSQQNSFLAKKQGRQTSVSALCIPIVIAPVVPGWETQGHIPQGASPSQSSASNKDAAAQMCMPKQTRHQGSLRIHIQAAESSWLLLPSPQSCPWIPQGWGCNLRALVFPLSWIIRPVTNQFPYCTYTKSE